MISWKYRFIFIHVPKCAGTSIMEALKGYYNRYTGHRLSKFIRRQINSGNFYVFTCVRNPWDRVVSNYHYTQLQKSYWHSDNNSTTYGVHEDYNLVKDATFSEYIDLISSKKLRSKHTYSQLYWLKPYINNIDKIIKIENIEDEFDEFCKFKNIQNNLGIVNKSNHDVYTSYYDSASIDKVREIYREDIEYFNYIYGE